MFFCGYGGVGCPSSYGSSFDPVVKIMCLPSGCVEHCEPPSTEIIKSSTLKLESGLLLRQKARQVRVSHFAQAKSHTS